MPSESILSRLRDRRATAALSQTELARRVGISRQALSAIEAGRQVPSTLLALQLARALGCTVDDLFRLSGGARVEAVVTHTVADAARVAIGRVGERLVAHPMLDAARAADGVLAHAAAAGERATIELLAAPAAIESNVLVAGCAPLLGVLAAQLGRRYADARATWIPADSSRALDLLGRELVHVAGVHLADACDPDAHVRAAQRALPDQRASLINLARWRQGLVVARGNPLRVEPGPRLVQPDLRWVTRDPGAGAQKLLERALRDADPSATPDLDAPRAADHDEVAQLVRWGVVDVGVAIESVALAHGLDFIPLAEERFDLVVPASRLDAPAIARILDLVDRPSFRAEAAGLPGYDLSLAGHASTVPAASAPPHG